MTSGGAGDEDRDEARASAARSSPSLLDEVYDEVKPCKIKWEVMGDCQGVGNDRVRRCHFCGMRVFDLSTMTRQEAEAALLEDDPECVRVLCRPDGRVMTRSCRSHPSLMSWRGFPEGHVPTRSAKLRRPT